MKPPQNPHLTKPHKTLMKLSRNHTTTKKPLRITKIPRNATKLYEITTIKPPQVSTKSFHYAHKTPQKHHSLPATPA